MTTAGITRCAVWARVSTADQHPENQKLAEWAERRGLEVVAEFTVLDSAWKNGNGKGREFDAARARLLEGARQGEYQVVVVWALDRMSRRGYADLSGFIGKLAGYGTELWSQQEQWLQTVGPFGEIVVHMLAWMAQMESERRSERIKAGLARKKAAGEKVGGGHVGAKDRKPRRREGYQAAWAPGGARRVAEEQRKAQGGT